VILDPKKRPSSDGKVSFFASFCLYDPFLKKKRRIFGQVHGEKCHVLALKKKSILLINVGTTI
jgi:hypothetical protein